MSLALEAGAALVLDWWLGEPRRWHPLSGLGRLAAVLARGRGGAPRRQRLQGAAAVALLAGGAALTAAALERLPVVGTALAVVLLYACLGLRSLNEHAAPVAAALAAGDAEGARRCAARIVSRDPEALEPAAAACESVLENGNDAVLAPLFWYAVAGAPGAVAHRVVNTLDALWGYRTPRWRHFGWAAARLDDLMGWAPARLAALTYALAGRTGAALACWLRQAPRWPGVNPGVVMAAGAGALGIRLGGRARYGGVWRLRPALGLGRRPGAEDIGRALALVRRGALAWVAVLAAGGMVLG